MVSIAPDAARTPHLILAASKAGPAGAAVAKIFSPSPKTISQLVPTSINKRRRLSRSIPDASAPAIMSPPTYAPSDGKITAFARGWIAMPISMALMSGKSAEAIINGATPSGSGSIPSRS